MKYPSELTMLTPWAIAMQHYILPRCLKLRRGLPADTTQLKLASSHCDPLGSAREFFDENSRAMLVTLAMIAANWVFRKVVRELFASARPLGIHT